MKKRRANRRGVATTRKIASESNKGTIRRFLTVVDIADDGQFVERFQIEKL